MTSRGGVIKLDHGKTEIEIRKIEYIIGDGNYSLIYLIGNKTPIVTAYTLKHMNGRLPGFVRIHKKTLVNPFHVTAVFPHPRRDAFVEFNDGRTLTISRRIAQNPTVLCKL